MQMRRRTRYQTRVFPYIKATVASSFHWQQMDKVAQDCLLNHIHTQQETKPRTDKKIFAQIQLTFIIKFYKTKFTGILYEQNQGFIAQGLPSHKGIQLL